MVQTIFMIHDQFLLQAKKKLMLKEDIKVLKKLNTSCPLFY